MARDLLAALCGYRHRFRAVPTRVGGDNHGRMTLLLTEVVWAEGAWVCEHLWAALTDELRPVCTHLGRRVAFTALVAPYRRADGSCDYELTAIGDVRVVGKGRGGR